MPGWDDATTGSLYHSFNMGRAHIVGINTDHEHSTDTDQKRRMLDWLDRDLAAANEPAARHALDREYHRPAYTSSSESDLAPRTVLNPNPNPNPNPNLTLTLIGGQFSALPVQVWGRSGLGGPCAQPGEDLSRLQRHGAAGARPPQALPRCERHPVVSGNPGNAEQASVFGLDPAPWTAWQVPFRLFSYDGPQCDPS